MISAAKEDIIKAYYPGYFMQSVENQIQTKQVKAEHDDSYQGEKRLLAHLFLPCKPRLIPVLSLPGYSIAVGEFSGDQVEGKSIKQS